MTKKRKFNAVDAAILIVIAAIIGAAAFLLLRDKPETVSEKTAIEYTVEFRKVHNELRDNISEGDTVIDSVAKYNIGKVTRVTSSDALYEGENMVTGQAVVSTWPGYADVRITVEAEATIGANGRYVISGGYDISVGTKVCVRTPNYNGVGYCTAIGEKEAK